MDRKAIDELIRERDILNKNLLKAAANTQKQLNLVKLHEQSKKNLQQEIHNYKDEAQKQRKIIYHLEKERDRYINEASDLTQKVPTPTVLTTPSWSESANSAASLPL